MYICTYSSSVSIYIYTYVNTHESFMCIYIYRYDLDNFGVLPVEDCFRWLWRYTIEVLKMTASSVQTAPMPLPQRFDNELRPDGGLHRGRRLM